jgi:hypothetical protein
MKYIKIKKGIDGLLKIKMSENEKSLMLVNLIDNIEKKPTFQKPKIAKSYFKFFYLRMKKEVDKLNNLVHNTLNE